MILKNCRYSDLALKLKLNKNRIVVYGAGMVGRIVVPYFIQSFGLEKQVECFVDMDERKIGGKIQIGSYKYKIYHSDFLKTPIKNLILLITNSKFYPVVEYLDTISSLDSTEGYIIPLIQLLEIKEENPVVIRKISCHPLIPQKIHYCWFGKKKMSEFLVHCMETWKRYCPNYEIICWNEDNYDLSRIPFAREAYERENYGMVTDAVRLDILYEQGGIYIDTDVSLMRSLDKLLYQPAFTGVEKWGNINTGGMAGAMPKHPMIKEMLDYRCKFHFICEDGSVNMETNGIYETIPFIRHGMRIDGSLQCVNGVTIYPSSVFHPYDYMSCKKEIRKWTISTHYFYGSWMDKQSLEERNHTQEKYNDVLKRIFNGGRPE